jgi:subtilisin
MKNYSPNTMKFWNRLSTEQKVSYRLMRRHRILPLLNSVYTKESPEVQSLAQIPSWAISNFSNRNDVWNITAGSGTIVAVLDTGISYNNPDLANCIVDGVDLSGGGGLPEDDDGHGSHCAGIIAGANDNVGSVGIAHQAKIMPIKVFNAFGMTSDRIIARGIKYAVDNGADIISMSLGGPLPNLPILNRAIRYANDNNVIVFAATGNDSSSDTYADDYFYFNYTNPITLEGDHVPKNSTTLIPYDKVNYPAKSSGVIGVGSYFYSNNLNTNILSSFTSCGSGLDILGPGDRIWSAVDDNTWYVFSGTSMATPFVAGVAALLVSYAKSLNKTLTQAEVLQMLQSNAVKLGPLVGSRYGNVNFDWDNDNQMDPFWCGSGIINLSGFAAWKNFIDTK